MVTKFVHVLFIICGFSISLAYSVDSRSRARSGSQENYRRYGYRWRVTTEAPRLRDVCPCVRRNDTGQCVEYDPKFQATTVEEAILNFPDLQIDSSSSGYDVTPLPGSGSTPLSAPGPPALGPNDRSLPGVVAKSLVGAGGGVKSIEPNVGQQPPLGGGPSLATGLCGSDRGCQDCSALLLNRLSGNGLLQGDDLVQVSKKFGIQAPQRRACDKYKFGRPNPERFRTGTVTSSPSDPAVDSLVKQLGQKGEENWRKRHSSTQRSKRDSSKQGATLGEQYKIDCTKRGEPVESGSSWVGLCNVCWAWRKLPANYFPQYVNELICDTDTKCMSGWGTCQQRYKTVDILQNTGTDASPTWKQVTISVANYCDCEVESGSGMHNFVAA